MMPVRARTSLAIAYPCLGPAARLAKTKRAWSVKLPNPPPGELRGLVRPAFRVFGPTVFSSESSLIVDVMYL